MPKLMDAVALANQYEKLLNKGENPSQQFVTKIPTTVAALLVRDCLDHDIQPGPLLRQIIADHYDIMTTGVRITFSPMERKLLDRLAELEGVSREEAVRRIIARHAAADVEAEQAKQANLRRLLGEPDPTPTTKPKK